MHFNTYLKNCREQCGFTQEKLVEELYNFNIVYFESLDTNMLSKWERGITKPRLKKKVQILKYFQHKTGLALPCYKSNNVQEAEELICKTGMKNLLVNSKKLILNFPSGVIGSDDLEVLQLKNSDIMDKVLDINIDLNKDFNQNLSGLTTKDFKKWALNPNNTFYVCEYKKQFFGLLFTVQLKPEIFEKLMQFKMAEKELSAEHFCSMGEKGCNYILSFFAMNDKAASLLFLRYFAYLLAHQETITDIGVATMMSDAKKLIENVNLHLYASHEVVPGTIRQTYRETLPNFIATEKIMKLILDRQDCPEE